MTWHRARTSGAWTLLRPGARLVLTDGAAWWETPWHRVATGAGEWQRYEAVAPDVEVDPTGAGDVFLATMLAAIVRPSIVPDGGSDVGAELAFAAAAASLAVERPGVLGVADRPGDPGPARARAAAGLATDRTLEARPPIAGSRRRPVAGGGGAAGDAGRPRGQVRVARAGAAARRSSAPAGWRGRPPSRSRNPVLVELGKLDAGDDGRPGGPGREGFPGIGCVGIPAEAAKQVSPIDREALMAPGHVECRRSRWPKLVVDSPRPPAEVRRGARRPPRLRRRAGTGPGRCPCLRCG